MLADGEMEGKDAWKNVRDGMYALYNAQDTEKTVEIRTQETYLRHIYGVGKASLQNGILNVVLPPHSFLIFGSAGENGVENNHIIYQYPIKNSKVWCPAGTWAAQYYSQNGKKEMVGFYLNGDILKDGEAELYFYHWENLQPK